MPPWRPILALPERNVGANDTTIQMGSVSGILDSVADELQLLRNTQAYLRARAGGRQPTTSLSRAFQRFYRLHAPLIRSAVRAHHLPQHAVDDCVQDIWLVPQITIDGT